MPRIRSPVAKSLADQDSGGCRRSAPNWQRVIGSRPSGAWRTIQLPLRQPSGRRSRPAPPRRSVRWGCARSPSTSGRSTAVLLSRRSSRPLLTPSPPLPSPPSLGERAQHAVRRICDRLHGTFVPAAGQRLKDVPTVTTHVPTDDATLLSFLQESLAKAWRPSFYCVASRPGCAFSADAPACDACHRLRAAVHGLTSDAVLHHPNTLDRVLCGQEVHERQMQECFDAFWESNKHACRPPPVWTPSQRCSAPASCGARGDASYCAACVAKWDAGASRGWTVVE